MAPRNNDPNTSYKRNYPVESIEIQDMVPCILHKKHKVVKLVKSHIRKIRQDGLICAVAQLQPEESVPEMEFRRGAFADEDVLDGREATDSRYPRDNPDGRHVRPNRQSRQQPQPQPQRQPYGDDPNGGSENFISRRVSPYFLLFLLEIFLLIFLMVYISAGPLSNSIAHTPIPPGSFVRTERPCHLEKKYLLRWSRPEHLE